MLKHAKTGRFSIPLFAGAAVAALFLFLLFSLLLRGLVQTGRSAGSLKADRSAVLLQNDTADPFITRGSGAKPALKQPTIGQDNPALGAAEAEVTLIQFSDFTCQYCRNQETVLRQLLAAYPGKIRLVWKDYPETAASSTSYQAALAARCAQEQGQFWPFHDLLFSQDKLEPESLTKAARQLKLNLLAFDRCRKDRASVPAVQADLAEADALGITGIPFLFVNGKEFMGEVSLEELKRLIEQLLK